MKTHATLPIGSASDISLADLFLFVCFADRVARTAAPELSTTFTYRRHDIAIYLPIQSVATMARWLLTDRLWP